MESIWNPYGIHMADDGTSWNIMAMDGAIAQHSTTLNGDHGDKAKPAKLFFVPHDSLRNWSNLYNMIPCFTTWLDRDCFGKNLSVRPQNARGWWIWHGLEPSEHEITCKHKTPRMPRMRETSRMKWLLAWLSGAQGQWVWLPTVEYSDWLRLTQTIASHCFTILAQKPPVLRLAQCSQVQRSTETKGLPPGTAPKDSTGGYTATRSIAEQQHGRATVLRVEQWLWWLWWIQAWPKEADSTKSIQVHWTWHQDTSSTFKYIWFIW